MIPNGNGNPFPKDEDEGHDDEPASASPSGSPEASGAEPAASPEPAPIPIPIPLTEVRLQPAPRPGPRRRLLAPALLLLLFGLFLVLAAWEPSGGSVREQAVATGDASASAKVVQIDITGVIARGSISPLSRSSGDMVARIKGELRRAEKDDAVKAVLLHIDSPGGTVTASDEIWSALQAFKAKTKKPVVVHMGGMCTSGGYYVAVAADALVCEPTTITGSIGVILSGYNVSKLMKEHGVQDVTITSGPNKDLLNPTAPRRKEQEQIVQGMVDAAYARFVKLVSEGRGLPLAETKRIADGRIYTADQAFSLKLVDLVGYRKAAFEKAKALAGLKQARLVRYAPKPRSLWDMLTGEAQAPAPELSAAEVAERVVAELKTPRLLALWRGPR